MPSTSHGFGEACDALEIFDLSCQCKALCRVSMLGTDSLLSKGYLNEVESSSQVVTD